MQEEFCHGGGSQELSWWPVLGRGWAGSKAVDGGAGGRVWLEMAKERISELKYITTEIIQYEIGIKWLKENRWSYRDLWVDKTFSKMCPIELLVQDGGVEEHVLISSCESTKIATSYWITINRRTLEPTKKYTPCPKKKKLQQDGRRCAIMIKSNPIHAWWVIHRLKNNNTKEVLSLLWRFWTPLLWRLGSLTIQQREWESSGIWPWGPVGFDYRPSRGLGETEIPVFEGTYKILVQQHPEERSSDPIGDWTKTTC